MSKIIENLKALSLMFCLTLISAAAVLAQQTASVYNEDQISQASFALTKYEQALRKTGDQSSAFNLMTKAAAAALASGQTEKARSYAQALLQQADNLQTDWNYGNAIHAANLILGRIELAADNTEEAKRFLLKAGGTPGSAQLNSFGPNMSLAKELLAKGEKAVVLEYFDLCAKFWKSKNDNLENWKAIVQKDEMPDFAANLRYQLEDWRFADFSKKNE